MNARVNRRDVSYAAAERIDLPPPGDFRGLYTEEAIQGRRSKRDFTDQTMTLEELSRLLFYTGGITGSRWGQDRRLVGLEGEQDLRVAPAEEDLPEVTAS